LRKFFREINWNALVLSGERALQPKPHALLASILAFTTIVLIVAKLAVVTIDATSSGEETATTAQALSMSRRTQRRVQGAGRRFRCKFSSTSCGQSHQGLIFGCQASAIDVIKIVLFDRRRVGERSRCRFRRRSCMIGWSTTLIRECRRGRRAAEQGWPFETPYQVGWRREQICVLIVLFVTFGRNPCGHMHECVLHGHGHTWLLGVTQEGRAEQLI